MSNMSYCRFENTSGDLADCVYAMRDAETMEELDLNEYELDAFHRMQGLCEQFLKQYQMLAKDGPSEDFVN